MRLVTLSGTVRLYVLFQVIPTTGTLENRTKQHLINQGWGIQSISITRQSYLNNTLNVTIVVNATGDDIQRRIDDGISAALTNFKLDGDNVYTDVNLRATADTGFIAPTQQPTPKPAPIKVTPKPKTPIKVGTVATVTVSASDEENAEETDFIDSIAKSFNVERKTVVTVGVIGIALLIARKL